MDMYEAMRAGTSKEKLIADFLEQIRAAETKINNEKIEAENAARAAREKETARKSKETNKAKIRERLVEDFIEYTAIISDTEFESKEDQETLNAILRPLFNIILDNMEKDPSINLFTEKKKVTDDDIIQSFISRIL